jgi:HD-GYP domain-containing protein (c-di-GMP phosphodiesterase class II)/DNA-binding LacI/PurR family transcriptional regulator
MDAGIPTMTDTPAVKKYTFGVLIDGLTNPYQRSIAEVLTRNAEENRAELIFFLGGRVHSDQVNENRMKYIYQLISPEGMDGLILVSSCLICDMDERKAYARLVEPSPVINIGQEIPGGHNIVIDNSSGMRRIVRHLVEEHHAENIAFIGGMENHPDAMERHQTFRQTLEEMGIPFDPELYYAGDFVQESGVEAVRRLFSKGKPIDTLVVANDPMAIGAMDALRKMGKRIPEDVRITGFDNIPDSSYCIPGLTTAGQPFAQIGRQAIRNMVRLLEKKDVPGRILFPVDMIVRQSCGCCPEAVITLEDPRPQGGHEADHRHLAGNILRRLPPEFGAAISGEMKKAAADLLLSLLDSAEDKQKDAPRFLSSWNGIVDRVLGQGYPAEFLEYLLIVVNQHVVSDAGMDPATFRNANIKLQNAWFLLLRKLTDIEKGFRHKLEREDIILQFFRGMTGVGDLAEEMSETVQYYLPRLNINNYFLAEFTANPNRDQRDARIILYQTQDPKVSLSNNAFPASQLIPGGIRSLPIKPHWVVEAVSLYDDIGYLVLEMSNTNLVLYSHIRTIISSYIQEYLLYQRLQNQAVNLKNQSEELSRNVEYLRKIMGAVIQTLSVMVETKDPYTAGHERRVADLARSIANGMGLPYEQAEAVRLASSIHDIGKLYIPSEILNKPGELLEAEYALIKLHPKIAFDILKNIEFPWPLADIVYQHHERLDGSGYPCALEEKDILVESRIIAVADVVEAMASHRPYRPSRGIDAALQEISDHRGSKYDPDVVDICLRLFREEGYTLKS